MTELVGKVVCGIAGLLVGVFAVVFLFSTHTSVSNQDVIDAVYPLFSDGLSWSPKVSVNVPPHSDYNSTGQAIVGYEAVSLPTASTGDIGAVVEPLRNYYDQLLVKSGWTIDPQFEADGPGGSLWGFAKGNDILILSYTSTFMNQQQGQPRQCPCTIVFTIIGGTLK